MYDEVFWNTQQDVDKGDVLNLHVWSLREKKTPKGINSEKSYSEDKKTPNP